jgi:SAM-dependent methyltransferase
MISKYVKSITKCYNKLSDSGKILLFTSVFLILVVFFKSLQTRKEGFSQNQTFLFKTGPEIYDDFYASIYDQLVFNNIKNDYEIGMIVNKNVPNVKSIILDVGCGTGHHVAKLSDNDLDVIGIDVSPSMISQAKKNYPTDNFQIGNVLDKNQFINDSFTHILCLYFTIYYLKDKQKFFYNCMDWLKPGGFLIVHLVDREKFDPILPPGNPLYIVSPQKYAKKRITHTKIHFDKFLYNSNFQLEENTNIATFQEKFKFNDGTVRKQEHIMYMEPIDNIINLAQEVGFIIQGKVDLMKVAYENQYLYVFLKPS